MSDTPRTDAECKHRGLGAPVLKVSADFARELERDLAQRTAERDDLAAEVAALKAQADPLAEMWAALEEYQPLADRDGHGESWKRMCKERTRAAAADATNPFVNPSAAARAAARAAAGAAANLEEAMNSAADAVTAIRRAREGR